MINCEFKNTLIKVLRKVAEKSGANLFTHFKHNLYNDGHKDL